MDGFLQSLEGSNDVLSDVAATFALWFEKKICSADFSNDGNAGGVCWYDCDGEEFDRTSSGNAKQWSIRESVAAGAGVALPKSSVSTLKLTALGDVTLKLSFCVEYSIEMAMEEGRSVHALGVAMLASAWSVVALSRWPPSNWSCGGTSIRGWAVWLGASSVDSEFGFMIARGLVEGGPKMGLWWICHVSLWVVRSCSFVQTKGRDGALFCNQKNKHIDSYVKFQFIFNVSFFLRFDASKGIFHPVLFASRLDIE